MTLQLDARRSASTVSFDDDPTVVADVLRLPVEAFGPTSEFPTVLAKANPVLEFALSAATGGSDEDARRVARVDRPSRPASPTSTRVNRIVAGIWTATFLVLSVLAYLVTTAPVR